MEKSREKEHRRNEKLEILLQKLNDILWISEETALLEFQEPQFPVLLVVGCPRSGSTLLTQWLSNLGVFCYPSNLLSRFYQAPYIGALIQKLLTDPEFAFRGELIEFEALKIDYKSTLGKTKGVLSPHNFLYFWRRFFNFGDIQKLAETELKEVNDKIFLAELAAIEAAFEKPLALKAMIINWNITFLNEIFPKFLFLHIRRDPLLNAQSLLNARKNFYGSIEPWYSYKPPEYPILKQLSPYGQVAGQVYYTNKAISDQLKDMNTEQWLEIDYSSFCAKPEFYYSELLSKLNGMGLSIDRAYSGSKMFMESSEIKIGPKEVDEIMSHYNQFLKGNYPEMEISNG